MKRSRDAACALVLVVLLPATGMSPLAPSADQKTPLPLSQIFQPGKFSQNRLGRWLRAVNGHEPGTTDEFFWAVRSWTLGDLLGATRDFDEVRARLQQRGIYAHVPGCDCTVSQLLQSVGLTREQAAGDEILERAAILHSDVAIVIHTETARTDRVTIVPANAGWQVRAARACVGSLYRRAPRNPFVRQWYASLAAFLHWRHEVRSLPLFVEDALKLFPADPDLLMVSGCMHEYLASPRIQESGVIAPSIAGDATAHLRQAEKAFRQAMRPGVPSPELSMRLGHVLGLLGRHDEALSVLKLTLEAPGDVEFGYFTNLFIGDAEAARGHDDLAQQAYRRAEGVFPSQSAYLASSRLARRAGDRSGAAAALDRMLALKSETVRPWPEYYFAGRQAQAEQLLFDLRAPFRKATVQ